MTQSTEMTQSAELTQSAEMAESIVLDPERPLWITSGPGELTVAVVSIAWLRGLDDGARNALIEQRLDDDEAAFGEQLPLARRRTEWLAGRLAAKYCVGAHLRRRGVRPMSPRDVRVGAIGSGPRAGRPFVNAPVDLGLTHSADFAVAACGPRAVGVDLEFGRSLPPALSDLLTLDERDAATPSGRRVAAMPLPLRWACKEAVLKQAGVGLRLDSREVRLTDWRDGGRFTWQSGPELTGYEPAAARREGRAWQIGDYALAILGE
jgi:4'-phosphopantetheinyl transferase